jgi:hypothetical protein
MKRIVASILCCAIAAFAAMPANADPNKQLQNLKGTVDYQPPTGPKQSVAPKATIGLNDMDSAITGANSLAAVGLPDSSRVLIGSSTNVQLSFFNRTDIANAQFIVYQGKIRFTVQHPAGAHANYTFKTPTAQLSVRGTVGDIDVEQNLLQVNVYDVTDPTMPVQVTLNDGQVFYLGKGQTLIVHIGAGNAMQGQTQALTHPMFDPFAEFNLPDNARELGLLGATHIIARPWFYYVLLPIFVWVVVIPHHPADNGPNSAAVPIVISGIHPHH